MKGSSQNPREIAPHQQWTKEQRACMQLKEHTHQEFRTLLSPALKTVAKPPPPSAKKQFARHAMTSNGAQQIDFIFPNTKTTNM